MNGALCLIRAHKNACPVRQPVAVTFSPRATEPSGSATPMQSWFLDLSLVMDYWSGDGRVLITHAPINAMYALHESLLLVRDRA